MNALTSLVGIFLLLLVVSDACMAAEYIGSSRCAQCHEAETQAWRGSHHDLAMAEASTETVLGNFNNVEFTAHGVTSRFYRRNGKYYVRTDGPEGKMHDYAIRYTFGWYPLQQYLIEFPRGHVQSLGLAWDSRPEAEGGQRWFHLYPEEKVDYRDRLHWTQREQTWNYQCAECHSTNLQKNYTLETDSYRTTWSDIDVACEACHGPGSGHAAWAEQAKQNPAIKKESDKGLVVDLADRDDGSWSIDAKSGEPHRSKPRENHTQIELCARCHSRRGQIWADYEYGKPLGNTHRLALLDEHLYYPDGQIKEEVYVYGSFIQSHMYQEGVTCSDCHEPHSLQLRAKGNALCGRCHLPERYDTPTHHHHEAGTAGAACINCHMPQRNYMVIDARADHSMRVPRPDLSVKLGTPNACTTCHADRTADWATKAVTEWYPASHDRGPHYGEALHAAVTGSADAAERLSALAADASQPGIVRATAVNYLRNYAQPQQLPLIETLLNDKDPLIRASAVRFLEVTDLRTRVDKGWLLLDDHDRVVRLDTTHILAPLLRQQLPEQYRSQLEKAIKEYVQAQQVNAERPEAHLNLGLIAIAMGNFQKAEEEYRTALRLEATFVPGYINLVDLYRQLGQDADGEKLLYEGIKAVGDNADLQYTLGLLLVRQKRIEEAQNHLRQAATLAEDNPRYVYVYALALERAGDKQQALTVLTQANQRHPGNAEITATLNKLQQEVNNSANTSKSAR
jgi:tetratricopeptide (TPR) repeat protein